eukprot:Hpha_TRINITY_DN23623_c0_g1::TRINITY_DN23623_c0_g1_i1::g.57643::m.57643
MSCPEPGDVFVELPGGWSPGVGIAFDHRGLWLRSMPMESGLSAGSRLVVWMTRESIKEAVELRAARAAGRIPHAPIPADFMRAQCTPESFMRGIRRRDEGEVFQYLGGEGAVEALPLVDQREDADRKVMDTAETFFSRFLSEVKAELDDLSRRAEDAEHRVSEWSAPGRLLPRPMNYGSYNRHQLLTHQRYRQLVTQLEYAFQLANLKQLWSRRLQGTLPHVFAVPVSALLADSRFERYTEVEIVRGANSSPVLRAEVMPPESGLGYVVRRFHPLPDASLTSTDTIPLAP